MLKVIAPIFLFSLSFPALALVPPDYQEPPSDFTAEIEAGLQLNTGNTESSSFNGRTQLIYDTKQTKQEATLKAYFASEKARRLPKNTNSNSSRTINSLRVISSDAVISLGINSVVTRKYQLFLVVTVLMPSVATRPNSVSKSAPVIDITYRPNLSIFPILMLRKMSFCVPLQSFLKNCRNIAVSMLI